MGSDRPYRQGMTDEKLDAILHEGAGSQWDAQVVEAFRARDSIRQITQEKVNSVSFDARGLVAAIRMSWRVAQRPRLPRGVELAGVCILQCLYASKHMAATSLPKVIIRHPFSAQRSAYSGPAGTIPQAFPCLRQAEATVSMAAHTTL